MSWKHQVAVAGAIGFASVIVGQSAVAADAKPADKNAKVTYDDHVKPIFREKCGACHNPDKKTAGLDLMSFSGTMAGGGSGAVVEAGESGSSYLYSLVSHTSEPYMPPKADKLPAETLAIIAKWIDGGALENSGSKAMAPKKPKMDLALKGAPVGKPEGPPPMPLRMSLEPVKQASRSTAARTIATNPWSPLAAVAGQGQVLLYNTKTLELVGVLPFPEGEAYILKFSRNGLLLLAGGGHSSASGRVVVWNVKTGERVFEVGEELDAVLGADISADLSLIALGGPSKMVRVYSTADGSKKFEMKKHTDWVYSVAFSPDGVLLATADRNGGLVVWEAQTGREFLVLAGHPSAVTGLSWRIDSNLLASASEEGTIKLWEMENGSQVKAWAAHPGGASAVNFTRDGRLVSCGRDKVAKLWDQNGAQQKAFGGFADILVCTTFCDESSRVFVGEWSGSITAWNPADGKQIGQLEPNPPTLAQRVNESQQRLAARQAEIKPFTDQFASAQKDQQAQQATLDAASKLLPKAEADAKAAAEAAGKIKASLDGLTAQLLAAQKTAATLEPVVPALKEAAAKGKEAAGKVAGDKELAAAADLVQKQFEKHSTQLEAAKKTVAERTAQIAKEQPGLAPAQKQAADLAAALAAAKKQIADLTPAAKAATDKAAKAKQSLDGTVQAVATAERDIKRWKDEIVFRDKTIALAAEQTKANALAEAVQIAQAAVDTQKAEVAKRQQSVAAAKKAADDAIAAAKKNQELIAQLDNEHKSAIAAAGAIDGVLPKLRETLAKADEAAGQAKGDAEIAAAATQVKALVDKKVAQAESLKKLAADKTATSKTAQGQVPVLDKKVADAKLAITAAEKAVLEATAAIKPLEDKVVAAKAVQSEGMKTVDAVRKEVDALRAVQPAT